MEKAKIVMGGFLAAILMLFFYSYTQVDLSLTLSKFSIWQIIQKSFQFIGYFNRPLSTFLYIIILILLFGFYGFILYFVHKNKIKKNQIWTIILASVAILIFAYNAFSYDIFNYIFDAKIFTFYHQNPYLHRALDFPHDPMLSFMHWVERNYPYGPFWLILTIPISFIGFQFFLPTFFLFKALGAICFVCTCYFLSKIVKKSSPKEEVFSLALFALNPLVIIESLVSAHNDIVMMFFAITGIFFLMNNKNIRGLLLLIISIGIKFATIFLLPIFIFAFISKKLFNEKNISKVFVFSSFLMIIPIVLASFRTNFQPWYLLFWLPFASLLGLKYYSVIPVFLISFFALLNYVPFLYLGNWNSPVPSILFWLNSIGIVSSGLGIIIWKFKNLSK